jgi:hypothetical protein
MAKKTPSDPIPGADFPGSEEVWKLRRAEPRVTLQLPVSLYGMDKWGDDFSEDTVTENVSRQGACVETIHELELGTVIELSAFKGRFHAQARVTIVWSRKSQSGKYRVGLRFVESSENWIVQ